MDIRNLIRDPDRIKACFTETPDGRLVTSKEVKIYIPARFEERNLAEVGVEVYIVGVYAVVLEDKYYSVSTINAMVRIEPNSILKMKINGVDHYEFTFKPGGTVISSLQLVKKDTLVYRLYDELFSKGRVPWYLNYYDLGTLLDSAKEHAGTNVGEKSEVIELIVSMLARDPTDRTKYYRMSAKTLEDVQQHPPAFIPLKSVFYAATNTTNKLAGSYFSHGVVGSLVSPADRTERLEALLSE
jgi:hypothetical protein